MNLALHLKNKHTLTFTKKTSRLSFKSLQWIKDLLEGKNRACLMRKESDYNFKPTPYCNKLTRFGVSKDLVSQRQKENLLVDT